VRKDVSGRNDLAMEVPTAEEEAFGTPAPAAAAGGFWGEEEAAPAAGAPAPASGGGEDFWGEQEAAPAASGPAAEFSDAVAIQLPQQLPVGIARPYFLSGDGQQGVDLWFLDLARGRVRQLVGRGTGAIAPLEGSDVEGAGRYDAGEWSAVFVRSLRSAGGISFAEGSYVPVAFSVWDGTARERGNRRALTQWVYVYLQPREKPSALGPILAAVLGVLAVELLVVGAIRRRARPVPATLPPA
jgi:complex iron-sulfur molybdoenzyme family reductase subunit gamma